MVRLKRYYINVNNRITILSDSMSDVYVEMSESSIADWNPGRSDHNLRHC